MTKDSKKAEKLLTDETRAEAKEMIAKMQSEKVNYQTIRKQVCEKFEISEDTYKKEFTKEVKQTSLTPDQVKEITDYITARKAEKIEPAQIRKEVFKKFKIDTTQWELKWETKAPKGENYAGPVKKGAELKRMSSIIKRTENLSYKHKFTDAEKIQKSEMQAQLQADKTALEEEKKTMMNDFKTKIEEKQTQLNKVSREILTGYDTRSGDCEVIRDFDSGMKTAIINGEVVLEERLTAADHLLRQHKMDEVPGFNK